MLGVQRRPARQPIYPAARHSALAPASSRGPVCLIALLLILALVLMVAGDWASAQARWWLMALEEAVKDRAIGGGTRAFPRPLRDLCRTIFVVAGVAIAAYVGSRP